MTVVTLTGGEEHAGESGTTRGKFKLLSLVGSKFCLKTKSVTNVTFALTHTVQVTLVY